MKCPAAAWLAGAALALALASGIPPGSAALAQDSINLRDADIRAFIDDVARVTGASFIIDPRVQGKVSVLAEGPLGRTQYFELFLATLRANGFVAVPTGQNQYRLQPAEAGADGAERQGGRFATAVLPLRNIDAQQAVESLRPILSRNGLATANRAGNAVILSDFADNVARARNVLAELDRDRSETEVVQLQNAGARDLAQSLQGLVQRPGEAGGGQTLAIVPIDSSNALVIRGEAGQTRQLAALARELDQKAAGGSESRVIFLENADAGAILPVLQQLIGQAPAASGAATALPALAGTPFSRGGGGGGNGGGDGGGAADAAPLASSIGVASGEGMRRRAIIARYEGANALVIAASPEVQRELGEIIRQLDTRRAQVHVEAIIVEISDNAARQLGVQFLLSGRGGAIPLVSSNFSNAAPNLMALTGAVAAERGAIDGEAASVVRKQALDSLLGTSGITGGIGQVSSNLIFGAVLNAVQNDSNSNILSTPSLLTLDNQPARILVGQEIPVTTGEALGNNLDNSFRTVQRQDVGVQLSVKPQINAGGTVTLTLKQVVSSIESTIEQRDFVLNKRELETAITVNDGQILALGGLLEDSERKSLQKVPLLGDIPVLGNLFRSTTSTRAKTNLMIFIRPTIIKTGADADEVTARRWGHARGMQQERYGASSLDALALEYLAATPPAALPAPLPAPLPARPAGTP